MDGECVECGKFGLIKRGLCMAHYTAWWRGRSEEERRRPTTEERFWAKVDKRGPEECWPWTGARKRSGHGEFHISRQVGRVPAARFSRELATGEVCPPGLSTCHHCDNPPCVNPAHVYFGTQEQNAADMLERSRAPLGSDRPGARLTEAAVVEMRERFAAGEYMKDLAQEFETSTGIVSRIVNGLLWKHAGGPLTTGRAHGRAARRIIVEPTSLVARPANPLAIDCREQVAVGRSFAAAERFADEMHAKGGV